MSEDESIIVWVEELLELEEARFLIDFHQNMEKYRQKAWNGQHIKHMFLRKVTSWSYMEKNIVKTQESSKGTGLVLL